MDEIIHGFKQLIPLQVRFSHHLERAGSLVFVFLLEIISEYFVVNLLQVLYCTDDRETDVFLLLDISLLLHTLL